MSDHELVSMKSIRANPISWVLILLLVIGVSVFQANAAEPVRVGVLAFRPKPQTLAQWQPLAAALKQAIPDSDFVIEAFNYAELDTAVASRQLDFVLTNSGHYVLLSKRNSLSSPLATLALEDQGKALSVFGGVIFIRSDTAGIRTLSDLKGKTIVISDTQSLGGYQLQAYELMKIGIRLPQDVKLVTTDMPHDNVVIEVLAGRADVGFVRTGVLEAMVREGKLGMAQIKILNRQKLAGFPEQSSTQLFPEWPFSALPHIDENLARHVAAALFALEENTTATRAIGIHGFSIPADYTPVEDMLRELRLPPFDVAPKFSLQDVLEHYRWQLVYFLAAGGLTLLLLISLIRTNRRLALEKNVVNEQKQELNESEKRFHLMADAAPVFIWVTDQNNRNIWFNKVALEFMGHSLEQAIGNGWIEDIHPEEKNKCIENAIQHFEQHKPFRNEFRLRDHEGKYHWVLDTAIPRFDEAGNFIGYIGTGLDITERKLVENELQNMKERLNLAVEFSELGIWDLDLVHDSAWRSLKHDQIFGYEIQPPKWGIEIAMSHVVPEDREQFKQSFEEAFRTGALFLECRIIHPDQSLHTIYATGRVIYDDSARPVRMLGTVIDITERKKQEEEVRIAATAFESQEGMFITDANKEIIRVNSAFTDITGFTAADAIGKNPRIFNSGRQDANFYAAMWKSINELDSWEGEIWDRKKNGEIYPQYLSITAVRDSKNVVTHYVAALLDITSRKKSEEEIRNLAFFDPLTQLPNRRLLMDRLRQALVSRERSGKTGALLLIDLDNFKTINDTLGHGVGDLLLKQVAERLTQSVRAGDTVSRIGGDEFVVMLDALSENINEAAAQTESIGAKILASLSQNYQIDTHQFRSTSSVGLTLFNGNQYSMEDLLRQADIAMYQAKSAGRNSLRFFDQKMQDTISNRVAIEEDLHIAIENRQFQLYYQIQMDSDSQPSGAEALIRWNHPKRGLVSPIEFIPLAEETGLILPIGAWVLETACNQVKAWQHNILTRKLILSVNVSAKQFHQTDFANQVKTVLQRHSINPDLLKLELTESILVEDMDDTITKMNALKKIGVRLSLDDFGTGYSSLQYLKLLPLNQVKIDQSFVRDIAIDSSDEAIVKTIINLAQNLNMSVIAEGVETEEQRQFLLNNGCTHYQGYLFGKPVPIDQFQALLKRD